MSLYLAVSHGAPRCSRTFVACDRYLFGDRKRNCVISGFLCKRSKDVVSYLAGSMFSVLLSYGGNRTGHDCAVCASTAVKVFGDLCWESGLCVN